MNRKFIYILIAVITLISCSKIDNNINTEKDNTFKLKLAANAPEFTPSNSTNSSKAHFSNITENNTATFVWDNSKDMLISLMSNNSNFIKWNSTYNYSLSTITPDSSNPKIASIESEKNLNKKDLLQGGTIMCFAPINKHSSIKVNTNSQIKIEFGLPNMFNVLGPDNINALKEYTFVYGKGNVTNNNLTQSSTKFNTIPAIIRFKVLNSTQNPINIKSVKLSIKDKTTKKVIPFPNKLVCNISNNNIVLSENSSSEEYYQSVGVNINSNNSIAKNSTANYYLYVLPTTEAILKNADYEFTITDSNNKEYKIINSSINIGKNTNKSKFCNGYLYTFNIDISKSQNNEIDPQPDNTSYKQRVLGLFFTGTDCSKCPTGIVSMYSIKNDAEYKDKVIFTELHSSSSSSKLYTSFGYGMLLYCGNATPTFDFNMKGYPKKGSTSVNAGVLKSNINTELETKTNAGIAAKVYIQNNQIITEAYVKVSKAGNYAIGAWVLEDEINEFQSNSTGNNSMNFNIHNNVFRVRDTPYSPFVSDDANKFPGVETSEINPSKMYTKTYKFDINSNWNANKCKVIVFVSVKDSKDNKYYVTNVIECGVNKTQPFEYNE